MAKRRKSPKSSVYLETTVVSYLAARPSRDIVVAAHQELTRQWWRERRARHSLWISEHVLHEASAGDPSVAARRLEWLAGIPVLTTTTATRSLALHLIERGCIPSSAVIDAFHVAVCAVHSVDYLLTWNCRHIANIAVRRRIEVACSEHGFVAPALGTPEELMGE